MKDLLKLSGFEISYHEKSNRVINIKIEDEIIDRLAFPFKKFNITALEYKPFTRFTIAKSLDETASNKLSNFLNEIIKDRQTGCFIIAPAQTGKHQCGRTTFGHSLIISPWGKVLVDGKKKVGVVYAKINLEEVTMARQAIPNLSINKEYSTNT